MILLLHIVSLIDCWDFVIHNKTICIWTCSCTERAYICSIGCFTCLAYERSTLLTFKSEFIFLINCLLRILCYFWSCIYLWCYMPMGCLGNSAHMILMLHIVSLMDC